MGDASAKLMAFGLRSKAWKLKFT